MIDDPAIDDPAIDDPAIDDPAIDDAAVSANAINDPDTEIEGNTGKLTQITWKIKLDGNTTTSLSTKVFIAGDQNLINALNAAKRQLIVSRRYRTDDVREKDGECAPVRVSSYQVIANVVNPVLTNNPAPPDQVNPPLSEPSTTVPPGSAVYLTLRVCGDVPGFTPERVGAIVASQPDNPAGFPPGDDTDIPIQITTATLPDGTQGVQDAQQLAASNGVEPDTWSLDSGVLPGLAGELTLSPSGLISGTSSIDDGKVFVVKVTDASGKQHNPNAVSACARSARYGHHHADPQQRGWPLADIFDHDHPGHRRHVFQRHHHRRHGRSRYLPGRHERRRVRYRHRAQLRPRFGSDQRQYRRRQVDAIHHAG